MFYFEADLIHLTVHAVTICHNSFMDASFLTNHIANPKPFSRAYRAGFSLRLCLQLSKYSDMSVEENNQFVGKKSKLENEQLSTGMPTLIYNFYRDHFTNDEFPLCHCQKSSDFRQGFQRKSYHVG